MLQLLGKEDVALGIYEYGLRNVPVTDPNTKVYSARYTFSGTFLRCNGSFYEACTTS